ncbi:MAG: 50S ribosomal protein L9 [Bacteroidota bacterium]
MEVILKQDVKHLGDKDELVKVKPGYARNFLIPRGLAIMADDAKKKELAETLKQRAHKEEKLKKEAQATADKLANQVVKVGAKVGESGKIFGSVNAIQLAEALSKLGYSIDRKNITFNNDAIKTVGTYTAKVKLYKEVVANVNFEVVGE